MIFLFCLLVRFESVNPMQLILNQCVLRHNNTQKPLNEAIDSVVNTFSEEMIDFLNDVVFLQVCEFQNAVECLRFKI